MDSVWHVLGWAIYICAPIWVLINPFAVVRDEQSLQTGLS